MLDIGKKTENLTLIGREDQFLIFADTLDKEIRLKADASKTAVIVESSDEFLSIQYEKGQILKVEPVRK